MISVVSAIGTDTAERPDMSFVRNLGAGAIVAALFAFSIRSSAASGDYERSEDLTMEVVSCEEAYARLEDCCPSFRTPTDACRDYRYRRTSACNGTVSTGGTDPNLSIDESRCIRDRSCERLVVDGICDAWNGERPQDPPAVFPKRACQ